jgi:hypothetical protein
MATELMKQMDKMRANSSCSIIGNVISVEIQYKLLKSDVDEGSVSRNGLGYSTAIFLRFNTLAL